jgi:hypothetical protein
MSQPLTKSEAKSLLWRSGNLSWKLDKNQLEMREFIFKDHPQTNTVVIASSRRIGKTFAMLVISIELCLKTENTKVNYVAPTASMLRDYLFPMVEEIISDCPQNIRPDVSINRNSIKFKNGSEIKLAGTDNKRADKLRGRASDICIVDEAGFCTDLAYVVDSILQPTTLTTRGKIVLISTPASTMDHPFVDYMHKAQYMGTFIRKTIYDNPRLTPQDIQKMADIVGGVDSNQFRREYMCIHGDSKVVVKTPTGEIKHISISELKRELQKNIR